jgi:hypothetical protein
MQRIDPETPDNENFEWVMLICLDSMPKQEGWRRYRWRKGWHSDTQHDDAGYCLDRLVDGDFNDN